MRILVTGATGNVGSQVARFLLDDPHIIVRAVGRQPQRIREHLSEGVEAVRFDFKDVASYGPTLAEVDKIFLVRPPQISNVRRDIRPFIAAAQQAGVKQIAFLSLQGVEQNPFTPHFRIEKLIRESGIDWTFLRAGFFAQNLSTTHQAEIRDHNRLMIPAGNSRTSFIDVRDIGEAAARVLRENDYSQRAYTLTGPEALTYDEVAHILSEELGRPILYADPPLWEFVRWQRQQNTPWELTLVMASLYTITRFGHAEEISPDVERLLGRPPISFRQFAADYHHSWE